VFLAALLVAALWYHKQLWKVVLIEAGIFTVVAIINNFIVFGWVVGIVTLFLVLATQCFLMRRHRLTFPIIAAVVALFLVVAAMIFYMGYFANAKQPDSKTLALWGTSHFPTSKRRDPYTFCAHTWDGLTVLEYALFAKLAYYDPRDAHLSALFQQDLAAFFPNDNWSVVSEWGWLNQCVWLIDRYCLLLFRTNNPVPASYLEGVTFRDIYSPIRNVTVIAVRGTAGKRCAADGEVKQQLLSRLSLIGG